LATRSCQLAARPASPSLWASGGNRMLSNAPGRNRITEPKKDDSGERPPPLRHKSYRAPSVFTPDALLREARRQKEIGPGTVPDVCVLDPDGDILRHLVTTGRARR